MGLQLRVQRPPIPNISDLLDRCLNNWYNLSPIIYQGLLAFMPRRIEAVWRAKGLQENVKDRNTPEVVKRGNKFMINFSALTQF
ncbi:transposase domain containing protein [Nephila pilipes]|uniref:Transposase domain containing protein n=1 Tax=Nephila pilipes TaxID=299642 RepID=A0A8X6QRV7_NEPPI|nr:transposase domain containing protein [Nephila pilipes]